MTALFLWCVWCIIGGLICRGKHRVVDGIMWGLLLGPFGVIIALFLGDAWPKCSACRRHVDPDASVCPFCNQPLARACHSGMKVAAAPPAPAPALPPMLPQSPAPSTAPKRAAAPAPIAGKKSRARCRALDISIVMTGLAILLAALCLLLTR